MNPPFRVIRVFCGSRPWLRSSLPGGQLFINADATHGKLTVRLSDANRKPLPNFDHPDCLPLQSNQTRAPIAWQNASIADLTGKVIRLEIYIENADLYSFLAGG